MKRTILLFTVLLSFQSFAQSQFSPDWNSLDSRPLPGWYQEAKFGIFIHWGIYSVPAFSKVGKYSEWYWHDLMKPNSPTRKFHESTYPVGFTYPDFVPFFDAIMFDPQQWADIFKQSGAKYVVLTSKHHDGFCLWPSKEANNSWGRPWNSADTGPMRDLLDELTNAVRNNNLEMGLYYSLYEWFNPLYISDVNLYVEKHMIPQFKDVVERYQPSLIFSDGEWEHPASTWRSAELLAWLFNESSCKDKVVINDRWGKGDRHKHGGYFTTEYGAGLPNSDNPWEENRGMAHSFGYSRTENYKDYNTTQELVYMLIDIVSRGGNFLLDIGPTSDGRIPVIMQERLIEMGQWLGINGEAIYGTNCWVNTCQWSEGEIPDPGSKRDQADYNVMKLTVNPENGHARKEILFTQKEDQLYCICPVYPKDKLTIRNLSLPDDAKVTMLGYSESLSWKKDGKDIEISVPYLTASEVPCEYAWTFKIENIE